MSERKELLYKQIASRLEAKFVVEAKVYNEWVDKHVDAIKELCREHMPSGAGVDNGTKFDFGNSRVDRLVFVTSYHHMNDVGMYDGWTDHKIIVTPSLAHGINMRITGRNRNDIKGYLGEVMYHALTTELPVK